MGHCSKFHQTEPDGACNLKNLMRLSYEKNKILWYCTNLHPRASAKLKLSQSNIGTSYPNKKNTKKHSKRHINIRLRLVCGSRKVKETKTISLILFQFPFQVSGLQRGFLGLFTFTIDSLQQQRDTLSLSFPVNKHTYMYITFFSKSIQFNDR